MSSRNYKFGASKNFLDDDLRSSSSMSQLRTKTIKPQNKLRSDLLTLSKGSMQKGLSSKTSSTANSLRAVSSDYLIGSSRTFTRSESDLSDFSDLSEDIGDVMPRLSLNDEPTTSGPPPKPKKKYKNGTRHSMSFSNDKFREIERVNSILLKRIMGHKKPMKKKTDTKINPIPASLNRQQQQRQIDMQNAILDKKIREAGAQTRTRF